ncbi:MAG: tetratricopeptide repeat protein [Bacteroidota bacterium]
MNNLRLILGFLLVFLAWGQAKALEPDRYADSIEHVLRKTSGKRQQVEIMLSATRQLNAADPDKALVYATRALAAASGNDFQELRLQAMIEVSKIQVLKTQFPAGMAMVLKAKELASRLENKKELGEACVVIGMIRIFQGNYTDSYESYFTALRLFEEIGDQEGSIKAMNGIGNICYYQQNINKACIYYVKALKIARETFDTIQIANVVNNVGLVLVERGQTDSAIACYREAIAIHTRLGLKIRLATNYMNLGVAYMKEKKYDDFLSNFNKAIAISASVNSRFNLAMCNLGLSDYYEEIRDPANRVKYAMLALSDGQAYKLREIVFEAAGVLHDHYLATGKIDSAYKYAMIRNAEKDSIDNEHSAARLTLLEMEHTYDKKLKEDSLRQQRKDFITIIMVILAVSGMITISLFLSRQIVKTKNIRLEKQRLSDEVDYKNKELAINVMNLLKKNEFLVEHTNRLIEIQQKAAEPDIKSDILQLIKGLQRGSGDEIWDEFEVRFKQVHSGFYDRLLVKFPELSSNELKLCALLKLNLSTKEICELTGQRPASLDVARSRLRKKLGIVSSQTNLVSFLSQI